MKKVLVCIVCLFVFLSVQAVNYCAPQSWGYAGNVTGGGNVTPTLVNSATAFKNELESGKKVIIITQNITIDDQISTNTSNLTIMALPGVRLISNSQSLESLDTPLTPR